VRITANALGHIVRITRRGPNPSRAADFRVCICGTRCFYRFSNSATTLWREILDRLFLDARRAGEIRAGIEIVPLGIFTIGALNWTIEWV
jgi:hypothetical protein